MSYGFLCQFNNNNNNKNSSSENVATADGSVFWKSSRSKKVALQKKIVMRDIAFLKN